MASGIFVVRSGRQKKEAITLNHKGSQRLETDRVLLRWFTLTNAAAMYKNWVSDPEVTKFLTWPEHDSEETRRETLVEWEKSYEKENYYQWAIILKENGNEPIGRNWWHQGIMSEALIILIDFFFEKVGANRIESLHDPRNPHSGMVMKKCGMKYEGTLRSSDRNNQGICDADWYGLLRSEREIGIYGEVK